MSTTPDPAEPTRHPADEAPANAPGTGETLCRRCEGTGKVDGSRCPDCDGTGIVIGGIGGG